MVLGYPDFENTHLELEKAMQPQVLTHGNGCKNRVPTSKLIIYTKIIIKIYIKNIYDMFVPWLGL